MFLRGRLGGPTKEDAVRVKIERRGGQGEGRGEDVVSVTLERRPRLFHGRERKTVTFIDGERRVVLETESSKWGTHSFMRFSGRLEEGDYELVKAMAEAAETPVEFESVFNVVRPLLRPPVPRNGGLYEGGGEGDVEKRSRGEEDR